MTQPPDSGRDDQYLIQYLLGLLPPEETERLDEASIADDDVAERLRIVEHDLVDAYARGTLAGDTLKRFESRYLSSPRRREQVAFARRFAPAIDRAAAVAAPAGKTWTLRRLAPRLAAAALLLALSGTVLFQATRRSPGSIPAQTDSTAPDTARPDDEPAAQPKDAIARGAITVREPQPAAQTATAAAQPAPPVVAIVLLPQTRGIAPIPALAVPRGTGRVAFDLRLESNDFPRYQVGLRDPAVNKIVWRSGWIVAGSSAGQPTLRVTVPAGLLKSQHYTLDLTGRGIDARPTVAGSYAVEIVAR